MPLTVPGHDCVAQAFKQNLRAVTHEAVEHVGHPRLAYLVRSEDINLGSRR